MEIPEISIPNIEIPQVYVPQVSLPGYEPLNVETIGCKYFHRDVKNTGNRNLLIDDPNGTYTVCPEGQIPSYNPMRYDPNEIIYTEDIPRSTPATPTQTQQKTVKPKKDKKIEFEPCPSKSNQRVGDFRNEKRLERVIGHKRGDDGIECITLYEDFPFKDQYIPEVSSIVSTAVIGLVAASSPLLLNIIKPLVKNVVKKLTKNKKDVK